MKRNVLNNALNKHQIEILNLFSRELEDEDLIAIKRLIVKYLADKITKQVDTIWEEKQWTPETMENLLENHQRKSYNPKS